MQRLSIPAEYILEETGRNTGAAVLFSALASNLDDVLCIMPSDHWISDEIYYCDLVSSGISEAKNGRWVTFGIKPTIPATGYGYIKTKSLNDKILTVEKFVEKGAKTVILDINEDNANKIIENLGDDNVMFVSTNIMEEDPVVNAINQIKDKFGGLHIAVNCAGTGYPGRILGKEAPHPLDAFQFIINLNLVGTFNVMRIAAELMDKIEPDEKGREGSHY